MQRNVLECNVKINIGMIFWGDETLVINMTDDVSPDDVEGVVSQLIAKRQGLA